MDLKLHANATTTPRTRAYIQKSQATNTALAHELGIHSRTVARWKARHEVTDRSTRRIVANSRLTGKFCQFRTSARNFRKLYQ